MSYNIECLTINDYYNKSILKFANNISFEIIGGESLTYKQFGEKVEKLKDTLNLVNIPIGEKIAIIGGSMPNWPVSYMSITTSGRIVVPLLPDFSAFEIANILEHAQSKSIIISKKLIYSITIYIF